MRRPAKPADDADGAAAALRGNAIWAISVLRTQLSLKNNVFSASFCQNDAKIQL